MPEKAEHSREKLVTIINIYYTRYTLRLSLWQDPDDVSHRRILTKLNGGLSRLHSADEDAVLWLTSYG